ncbi:MAG TPA: zinc ribbon domain-containing protein [Vicinamibacterales bacterium]
MPLYEYLCDACGQRFEVIQRFSDPAPDACAKCGKGPVERQKSSPAIQFKGSGFYITDYARKGGSTDGDGAKGGGAKKDGGKESSSESSAPSGDGGGESKKSEKTDSAPAAASTPPAPPAKT